MWANIGTFSAPCTPKKAHQADHDEKMNQNSPVFVGDLFRPTAQCCQKFPEIGRRIGFEAHDFA
jgi:hypothetical protein